MAGNMDVSMRRLKHAEEMLRDGAKIIDIGGESTRPGHVPVSLEEELERTVPVIEALTRNLDVWCRLIHIRRVWRKRPL